MAKKTAKKTTASKPKSAPPPANKGKAPAPLVWTQHGKIEWLAPDPDGDGSVAGGRIKMLTNTWKGEGSEPTYTCYRDGKYLGSSATLEAAKRRVQYRERSATALDERDIDDMPLFLKQTAEERRLARRAAPPPDDPALAAAVRAAAEREALAGARKQARRDNRAKPDRGGPSDDAVIRVLVKENPRKPGTGAHERFALLMKHDGKTVREYRAADGNMDTLENAVAAGRAKLEEKS